MTQKVMSLSDVTIVAFGENDYRYHFSFMTKSKAVDRMRNAHLSEKSGPLRLQKVIYYIHILMENNTVETMTFQQSYRGKSKGKCLEKGKRYYEENKKKLPKMSHD